MAIDTSQASVDSAFSNAELSAQNCDVSIKLPSFTFSFSLPDINLPNLLDLIPKFGFELSCDPKKPIDISFGIPEGGGRIACFDQEESEEDI